MNLWPFSRRPAEGGAAAPYAALLLICCAASAFAVQPSVTAIQPYGFQRGTEVEVKLLGVRLSDTQELLLYQPGVTVKNLEATADNQVTAKLAVAADCQLGLHALRVRSATGISNLRLFSVGALTEVAEKEPNSDFDQPQPIDLDCVINGIVQTEDVDHFVVEAKKGERITAEIEGVRLGYTFFDPYLAILNAERFELSRSDDAALLRQDCLCSVVAPADGRYIVQVRESAYGGNGNCKYRLHVGRFPRPTAVFPPGGRAGESQEITWLGDALGPRKETVVIAATDKSKIGLFAKDDRGIAPSPNEVRVADLDNMVETEPNNSAKEATACSAPGALNGIISEPGDIDYFKFAAKKGQTYDIRVYARQPLRSPLDSVLNVIRVTGGGRVGGNDDTNGPDSYYRFKAPEDDDYVVQIYDHLKAGGPEYVYRIEVAPVKQNLTLTLPEVQQYVPVTVAVPRDNRMAVMLNAGRESFGGDLGLQVEGLPVGVTLNADNMPAARTTIPLLFSATADAPLAGTLADVQARPTDENLKHVFGRLRQRTMLVRGQNNRDVWGHDADRLALAVTEPLPFKVDIVQPKVPIVRRGSMGLKVIATRQEGFNAPIRIRMLYNPPGIGSSGSISIPADKTEAVIPLTANTSAQLSTWKIVVAATASYKGANIEASTDYADLTVSDTFFDLAVGKSAAEQGQEAVLPVGITKKQDFPGNATARLVGLPAGTSCEPVEFNQDATEVNFKIKIAEDARPGRFKSVLCRAIVTKEGEPITHTLGPGELRIDKPLPPKPAAAAAPKPAPKPVAKPTPPAEKPAKPLSRLEQLRLEKKRAAEAAADK